jgi:hypothetical protein
MFISKGVQLRSSGFERYFSFFVLFNRYREIISKSADLNHWQEEKSTIKKRVNEVESFLNHFNEFLMVVLYYLNKVHAIWVSIKWYLVL